MDLQILAPGAVLVLWSLIMLMWLALSRFPAMMKSGMDLKNAPRGGRGQDLETVLPPNVNWKSHNYTHLMEQPTIFYPTIIILAMTGAGTGLNLTLAWVYVGLRIVHSLYQALINVTMVRFAIFVVATMVLLTLAINAVRATLAL